MKEKEKMTLGEIPIYYWSKLCKVKSFDLNTKSSRLLVICFWLIAIFSSTSLIVVVKSYNSRINEFKKHNEIIDNFEAKFALKRFFEDCAEDVKRLQNELTSIDGPINHYFIAEKIPQGYSTTDIHNLINKLSNQFILQDHDVYYDSQELEFALNLFKQLGYGGSTITVDPNVSWWDAHTLLWYLSTWMSWDESFYVASMALKQNEFIMAKSSLAIGQVGCCYYWDNDSTAYSNYYRSDDFLEDLSNEEALSISQNLPLEYSLDSYSNKYESTGVSNHNMNYYPNFLIEPFEQISFFEPEGFNPYDLKNNLENFKTAIGNSKDIHINSILKILIIVFLNVLFVITIRLINWVNNG